VVQTLKEQIPEGDQRGKEAVVEGFVFKRRQLAQGAVGKQLEEDEQQLGRGKAGLSVAGPWLKGVFFGWYLVCIIYYMHTYLCYPLICEA